MASVTSLSCRSLKTKRYQISIFARICIEVRFKASFVIFAYLDSSVVLVYTITKTPFSRGYLILVY